MGGPSRQETEFSKRTPTNGNESVDWRAEQRVVLKANSTNDKTQR